MPTYTNEADLAKYLGRTFSDDENDIATLAIEAAEVIINRKTRTRYAQTNPQTYTVYQPPSPMIVLPGTGPYTGISVIGYSSFGSQGYTLTPNSHYEVRDATKGILWFPDTFKWYRIDVIYTDGAVGIPANIRLAANIMAAHWMRPILNDEIPGLANYSVGAEFAISFNNFVQEQGYPPEVDTLLGIPALYIA
jgi:hypothetical protein